MRSVSVGFQERFDLVRPLDVTTLFSIFLAQERGAQTPRIAVLPRVAALESGDALGRYYAAVERAHKIKDPHLSDILEVGRRGDDVWVVYAYEEGDTTLEDILTRRVPLRVLLEIAAQVAEGLDALHKVGVIHTDVRPSTVAWRALTEKVLLWNIGTGYLAHGVSPLMRESLNSPHPPYLAPEMEEHPGYTPATDIYALGALLYEMTTGSAPFTGTNPATIFAKQKTQGIRLPSSVNPAMPQQVEEAILHALELDPRDRYKSAGDMAAALRSVLAALPEGHASLPTPPVPQTAERPALFQRHVNASLAQIAGGLTPGQQRQSNGADVSQGYVICPQCHQANAANLDSCSNCWQTLPAQAVLTQEQALQKTREYRRKQLIRRALFQGGAALMVLLVGLWFFLPRSGPGEGLAAPAGTLSAVSGPNDWAYFRRTTDGTGTVATDAPIPTGVVKWTFPAGAPMAGAPVVQGDRVFAAYQDNHLLALDRETGAVLWRTETSGPMRGAATVAGDRVIVGQLNTHVTAFDVATGQQIWDTEVDESIVHPVNVSNGVVYASGLDGTLFTLDAQTGARRWKLHLAEGIQNSPSLLGDTLVIGAADRRLNVIDAKTGRVRLEYVTDRAVESTAAIDAERRIVYFGSNRGTVFAVDIDATNRPLESFVNYWWSQLYLWGLAPAPTQSGTKWVLAVRGLVRSGAAVANGKVYVGTDSGILYAADAVSGKVAWRYPEKGNIGGIASAIAVVNNTVFFGSADSNVYALNGDTGEELWRFPTKGVTMGGPAYSQGVLFVATQDGSVDGTLYAIR